MFEWNSGTGEVVRRGWILEIPEDTAYKIFWQIRSGGYEKEEESGMMLRVSQKI